jgi:predicted phage tail protein
VVALKVNKADRNSPALGQGVVYRVKDSAITVAFEDVPEDGLRDSPLRIEKLTDEVRMGDEISGRMLRLCLVKSNRTLDSYS